MNLRTSGSLTCLFALCSNVDAFAPQIFGLATSIARARIPTTSPSQLNAKRSGAMSRKKTGKSGGFAKQSEESPKSEMIKDDDEGDAMDKKRSANVKSIAVSKSGSIYSRPALYDLAFGYRNYEEEVNFLLDVHDKYSTIDEDNKSESGRHILELAAGPARHTITALRQHGGGSSSSRVQSCTAVDLSEDMIGYSKEVADEELGDAGFGGMRDRFQYMLADMRTLSSSGSSSLELSSIDSAWILLGSMQHMTTNDDVIACLSSTSNLLKMGGTLTIELPHPRETFTMVECTRNGWEVPLEDESGEEYGELKIIWGDDDDVFDPIRQVRDFTVAMELYMDDAEKEGMDEADLQSVREIVPMRLFTYQEIDSMSRIAGFEVVNLYGALSDEVDVNSQDEAFRLVTVLRKVRAPLDLN
eukprot:CAMPEP_0194082762 /NCGR_PEP_ID=MMETSP0149-20130528/8189_1 /TAXON_ID=122233 /ORGANISM="Chaetoceros debilis, Strain MM31A-1" /LENGTH=414 /DNA_ID=CAMNT_0038764993 /DNA_START=31 /DNA_END=1275 /DNA_ORIENTATION=-